MERPCERPEVAELEEETPQVFMHSTPWPWVWPGLDLLRTEELNITPRFYLTWAEGFAVCSVMVTLKVL